MIWPDGSEGGEAGAMTSRVFLAGCPSRYSVLLMGVAEALLDDSGVPKLASVFFLVSHPF